MNKVVDVIFGSSNKKNGKTNSLNKNIPEISSAKKTLNELINKIIKLIAEKNELQEELNKMKKNKELKEAHEANKEAQSKNSKNLLDQIVKFDGYLSNIHESLSKEDTEKLLTEIQAKIRNNKSLNTQIANTIKLNRNNSNANANSNANTQELFNQNNSKRNIKKSPESLEELLGVSKNNRANNFKMNNRAQNSNSATPRANNNATPRPNSAGPRANNNATPRPNSAGPRTNNSARPNSAGPRTNNSARPNSSGPRVNNATRTNNILSKGLSSIAGIFLNQNKKINAETYNELNKLSSSIHNLER